VGQVQSAGLGQINLAADNNAISGSIPPLSPVSAGTSLQNLSILLLDHNQLTGQLPDLTGLDHLEELDVGNNHLGGQVPAPSQYLLDAGLANLCPNNLEYPSQDAVIEDDWTTIYQFRETVPWGTPWWIQCDSIFSSAFD